MPDLQRLIESSTGIRLVSALGRALPQPLGYRLADAVAARLAARRDANLVRAVRANQWVARGETLEKEALDLAVHETFRNSARAIFDLYHYIHNPEAARQKIILDEVTQGLLLRPEFGDRGLMLVGLHLSCFDLALQSLAQQGLKMLVLTVPDPQGGRRVEFEMRKRTRMNLVPASVEAIRQSLRVLQQGGVVLTGIDRPAPDPHPRPKFFGRPAALPTHHIYLALKARVPVRIIAVRVLPDGTRHLSTSDLIELEPHSDREQERTVNAEKVLSIAEDFIRPVPQQWSISLPVWPEVLDLVP